MNYAATAGAVDEPLPTHFIKVGEHQMQYTDQGAGETILFIHGTPTWSFEWRHVISDLAARYRCIAPDLLGFGRSDRPADAAYTPEAQAAQLELFVQALKLDRFTLVVHDYGGPIGLPLYLNRPDRVARLVLINTWMWSLSGDRAIERSARLAGSALGRWLYRRANLSLRVIMPAAYGDRRKLTPAIHQRYLERFPDAWSRGAVLWPLAKGLLSSGAFFEQLWQQRDRLRERPVLIIWGMKDSAFKPYQLARWRAALPDAEVTELPTAGHWPHEEEPAAVTRAVARFLTSSC